MKYLLLILIVAVCGYLGYGFSHYYVRRSKFFDAIILFCEKFAIDVNFSRLRQREIVSSFNCSSKDFLALLKKFHDSLQNNFEIEKDLFFSNNSILKADEQEQIFLFFNELGRVDVFNQIKELESAKNRFIERKNNADLDRKKFCPLYVKLGVIVGLLIALILF